MNAARLLTATALVVSLVGCSSWFGEKEKPPLEGRRQSIAQSVAADAAAMQQNAEATGPVTLPTASANTVWGQTLGYPTHNPGHLTLAGDLTKKLWSSSIGKGVDRDQPLMPSPIIAGERIYAMDTRGRVSAFDMNGKRLWDRQTRDEDQEKDELSAGGGIAYGRGLLLATNGSRDLVALNADTGAVAWRTPLAAPLRGAPAVLAGRAYVTDAGNHVAGLDAQTGQKLWSYDGAPEETALLGTPSPAVDNGRVVAPLSNGEIVALTLEDGQPQWNNRFNTTLADDTANTLRDIASAPVIDGGRAYAVNAAGRLMAVEIVAGARLWQKEARGAGSIWAAGDRLFITTREGVAARDARTGDAVWETPLPQFADADDKEGPIKWYGPYLLNDKIYAFGSDGKTAIFDPATGERTALIDMDDDLAAAPAVANGVVATVTSGGRLSLWK